MTLPKSLTTVTTISKLFALWLYIFLPFAGFYLGTQYQVEQVTANKVVSSVTKTPTRSSITYPKQTIVPLTECQVNNKYAEVTISPSDEWVCNKIYFDDEMTYSLILTSKPFTVTINNLGRGPYCQQDPRCVVSPFFNTNSIDLNLYTFDGKAEEVYGSFPPLKNGGQFTGHISIKYEAMQTEKLTEIEKNKLFSLLRTLVFQLKYTVTPTQPVASPTKGNPSNQTICIQDAKMCPDGSYVSRTGPNCEFAPCQKIEP